MALHLLGDAFEVHRYVVGPLDNNVYILKCRASSEALLVDAADAPELLAEAAERHHVHLVVQTHGHHDHIQAVPALRRAGIPVAISPADAAALSGFDLELHDGAVLAIGRLRVRAIATPGHTPGSMCFSVENAPLLFSGDTLFPGGPGATSSPQAFATIVASISQRLFAHLSDDTIVLPGHGEQTTIGAEAPHLPAWIARGW